MGGYETGVASHEDNPEFDPQLWGSGVMEQFFWGDVTFEFGL